MRSLQSYLFLGMHGAELSAYECVCRESILPAGPEPPARTRRGRALEFLLRVEAGGLVTDVGTPTRRFSRRIRLVGQQSLVHDWRDHGAGTVPPWDGRRPGRRVDQVPSEVPNLEVHARPQRGR